MDFWKNPPFGNCCTALIEKYFAGFLLVSKTFPEFDSLGVQNFILWIKMLHDYLHIGKWLLEVVMFYKLFRFFQKKNQKVEKIKFKVRTVLLKVRIVLGILKKCYLKLAILF